MSEITQKQINHLSQLGKKYGCDFYLPPFLGRLNPFFDITKVDLKSAKAPRIMLDVMRLGYTFGVKIIKKKKFMEIING